MLTNTKRRETRAHLIELIKDFRTLLIEDGVTQFDKNGLMPMFKN